MILPRDDVRRERLRPCPFPVDTFIIQERVLLNPPPEQWGYHDTELALFDAGGSPTIRAPLYQGFELELLRREQVPHY